MSNPHIISNILLLLDDPDGATPEPVLANVPNMAALRALYPTAEGLMTPESTTKTEADEVEYIGQDDEGIVALAEKILVQPKMEYDIDVKDINDFMMDRYYGPTGEDLDPARTYKAWAFIAVCSRSKKLTFDANVISALRLIKCYVTYSVKGDKTANGKELANMKLMVTVDLTKPSTNEKSIDTAA